MDFLDKECIMSLNDTVNLKDTVELLVKMLIKNQEDLEISEKTNGEGDNHVIIELKVNQEDRGRLIGRRGKTINAIRTLIKAAAVKSQQRISIEVLD